MENKSIVWFFKNYYSYVGIKIYTVLFLSFVSVFLGGLGISFVLPLLSIAQGNVVDNSNFSILEKIIKFLNIESLVDASILIIIIFFLKGGFKFYEGLIRADLESSLLYKIKSNMVSGIMKYDYLYFSKKNTGHFINALNEQIKLYISSFGSYIKLLTNIITTFVYLTFAFFLSWQTLFLASILGIFMLLFFQFFNKYIKEYSRKYSSELSNYNKIAIQSIHGFKYIVSTNQHKTVIDFANKSITELSNYFKKSKVVSAIVESFREPILIMIVLFIIVYHSMVLSTPIEEVLVVMLMIYRSMVFLSDSQGQWQKVISKIGSIEIVNDELQNAKTYKQKNGDKSLEDFKDEIELKDLTFSYDAKSKVLDNINFTIYAQKTIGIVGPSGSGKSTLLDIISTLLQPTQGKLVIDNISSKIIDAESWRSQIGYVCQDSVMFDDTIANNIGMWKGDFNNDENYRKKLIDASIDANAHSFIVDFDRGYDTKIGDRGIKLSGGQKQRIFIARELMKNPKILILDEATSALDSKSENMIRASIDSLKGKLTVVIVAHRISTIKNCDHIIVLNEGKIVEAGSFSELEKMNLHFKNMLNAQSV